MVGIYDKENVSWNKSNQRSSAGIASSLKLFEERSQTLRIVNGGFVKAGVNKPKHKWGMNPKESNGQNQKQREQDATNIVEGELKQNMKRFRRQDAVVGSMVINESACHTLNEKKPTENSNMESSLDQKQREQDVTNIVEGELKQNMKRFRRQDAVVGTMVINESTSHTLNKKMPTENSNMESSLGHGSSGGSDSNRPKQLAVTRNQQAVMTSTDSAKVLHDADEQQKSYSKGIMVLDSGRIIIDTVVREKMSVKALLANLEVKQRRNAKRVPLTMKEMTSINATTCQYKEGSLKNRNLAPERSENACISEVISNRTKPPPLAKESPKNSSQTEPTHEGGEEESEPEEAASNTSNLDTPESISLTNEDPQPEEPSTNTSTRQYETKALRDWSDLPRATDNSTRSEVTSKIVKKSPPKKSMRLSKRKRPWADDLKFKRSLAMSASAPCKTPGRSKKTRGSLPETPLRLIEKVQTMESKTPLPARPARRMTIESTTSLTTYQTKARSLKRTLQVPKDYKEKVQESKKKESVGGDLFEC